ncbi:MAG: endonuclease MutS2 [Clostridia bacterium]|nr:endonuclease MutS2 [Clostridia bacterium]
MLFTQKALSALEYDKIIAMLAERALTEGARARALSLLPSADFETVVLRQKKTADAKRMLARKGYPPFSGVVDVTGAVERAEKGATLSTRELLQIAAVLTTARSLADYHSDKGAEDDNSLSELFGRLVANRTLETRILRAIPTDDFIADEASPELADIRRKIRAAGNRVKDTLQKYISGAYAKYLQENIVTTRDGRYVVPVKAEYRNEIKGLIHDTSSSGATVFVEPMGVVEANNELRLLENKEQKEIDRILAELSAQCADYSVTIVCDYQNITELAFAFTCASLAEHMRAERPALTEEHIVSLKRARHPLLDREKVVPIDVCLGGDYQTIVITGPNTGGKTVSLKTLGLFALMVQAGLQIPAAETSKMGVFSEILVDIGDEQSIEQSLSTFSAHMVNIVSILEEVSDRSLVLFDELGAGTDPVEGAALANAILETTKQAGALTAATTHYAELKAYALETEGVQNASCEFDVETLRPTYRLIVGTPGKSNAFAISAKLGLDSSIIEAASRLVSGSSKRFENVIEKLEQSRIEMEKSRQEAARLRAEYAVFKENAERKLQEKLDASEKEIEKQKDKARQILESARATSDFVLKQLDEVKKKQESRSFARDLADARRSMRARMQETSDEIYAADEDAFSDPDYQLPRPLRVGDRVFLMGFGQEGIVQELPDKAGNVSVRAGILSAKLPIARLRLIEEGHPPVGAKKQEKKQVSSQRGKQKREITPIREFKQEIDVRGMIGDDAWEAVDKYLDEAVLAGIQSLRIIHGKGTGALRTALQNDLHHDPRVRSYRNGAYGEGDLGVTVVELK